MRHLRHAHYHHAEPRGHAKQTLQRPALRDNSETGLEIELRV